MVSLNGLGVFNFKNLRLWAMHYMLMEMIGDWIG